MVFFCWGFQPKTLNFGSTLPKFNMEPKNDNFQVRFISYSLRGAVFLFEGMEIKVSQLEATDCTPP